MNGVSDWELASRTREGDMHAFGELVRRYETPVVNFCQRMLGSREDAEDVAQECFLRVYRARGRLRPDAKFSTLLFGIARNLSLNAIRDAGRRRRGRLQSLTTENAEELAVHDQTHRPDRAARVHELAGLIEQAIGLLSPEHREVLVLREMEGLDYSAIARITRCQKGTVRSRLARAREQLRLRLVELGGEI